MTAPAPLTVGSLFAGIGGIDLGLERAGMRVAWQCETDPWCRRVLRRHWPDVPLYGDVRDVVDPPPVDVLAGGFPCQPVSLAGRRGGVTDDRWLWPEFGRLVRLLGPRYVFVENVPGIVTRGMGDVLGTLAALGYDAEWDRLGAADVGAPHRRRRIWIVAVRRGVADADGGGRVGRSGDIWPRRWVEPPNGGRPWNVESRVLRVAYGVPDRMDRLRGLGNAVVPQVAEMIGRWIVADALPALATVEAPPPMAGQLALWDEAVA